MTRHVVFLLIALVSQALFGVGFTLASEDDSKQLTVKFQGDQICAFKSPGENWPLLLCLNDCSTQRQACSKSSDCLTRSADRTVDWGRTMNCEDWACLLPARECECECGLQHGTDFRGDIRWQQ